MGCPRHVGCVSYVQKVMKGLCMHKRRCEVVSKDARIDRELGQKREGIGQERELRQLSMT